MLSIAIQNSFVFSEYQPSDPFVEHIPCVQGTKVFSEGLSSIILNTAEFPVLSYNPYCVFAKNFDWKIYLLLKPKVTKGATKEVSAIYPQIPQSASKNVKHAPSAPTPAPTQKGGGALPVRKTPSAPPLQLQEEEAAFKNEKSKIASDVKSRQVATTEQLTKSLTNDGKTVATKDDKSTMVSEDTQRQAAFPEQQIEPPANEEKVQVAEYAPTTKDSTATQSTVVCIPYCVDTF